MTLIAPDKLQGFAQDLLTAGGFAAEHAAKTAEVLVWANLRGTESHGVLRIPRYLEMITEGIIDPTAKPEVDCQSGAISVLDAHRAPGMSSMSQAMDLAQQSASQFGIGCCVARNISHAGAVGYYAAQAASGNMIGIVMTASGPLMAYHGSCDAGVSTNPIAIAAPSSGDPIVLDMSTSAVALGKIMQARDAGQDIPLGWAIDEYGMPTTESDRVKTLVPMAGPKGSGLSLMIEIMCSLLASNPVIAPVLRGEAGGMNGIAIALDIARFGALELFVENIENLSNALKSLNPSKGVDQIRLPGERGFASAKSRGQNGIPLADGTWHKLISLADKLGIDPSVYKAGHS
ncbi:ureidoglycolate dehydrogenase (NAD+) [Pacificibacter maritimus]|uniref:Ureidoglycolate dehydrogenase (NAD+) n=1 Tax=Pacificibacter maritimus TaxID=762213 RepID=A0A3N4UQI1_9RHOB|nr:Ldh family oxidoreductase [Pacificibacter maritimus]RPE62944.1 ureidoglycolate dehydrogenase (NAD+) [Pacificibacter maritimus]